MSLIVWLPFTKDLTQQGTTDLTVTNNGATFDSNGKLGGCYYFDGSAKYMQLSQSLGSLPSGDFSYAVWLKPTDSTRSIIISDYSARGSSGTASSVGFELTTSRQVRLYWGGNPDIYATNCILPLDTWTHVAISKSSSKIEFYMNGVLTYTYNNSVSQRSGTACLRIGDDYRGGTSVSYKGYMNDVRIYDHAISAREVKEIAQGLVCHYTLRSSYDESNIIYDCSGFGNNGTINGNLTITSDAPRYSASTTFNGSNTYIEADPLPAETKTISVWLKTPWSSASGYKLAVHDKNTGLGVGWATSQLITYVGTSNGGSGSRILPTWTADTWHHVVVVKTADTTRDVYIDGVLQTPNSVNYWAGDQLTLNIGNRHQGGTYQGYWDGQISDFRAFATALSADDIKQLYEAGTSIDNKGMLHTYELVEV